MNTREASLKSPQQFRIYWFVVRFWSHQSCSLQIPQLLKILLLWVQPSVRHSALQPGNSCGSSCRFLCLILHGLVCCLRSIIWKLFSFLSSFTVIWGQRRNLVPVTPSWLEAEVLFIFHLSKRRNKRNLNFTSVFNIHIETGSFISFFSHMLHQGLSWDKTVSYCKGVGRGLISFAEYCN